jgi:hypothetical protein
VAILQRHIVGLGADDGLSVRQFLNGGIEVERRLLSRRDARRREKCGKDRADYNHRRLPTVN